jgi:hypothetical protein
MKVCKAFIAFIPSKTLKELFFLPKNKTLSLSQISQYFYEYKNQKRSKFSSLKKERRYCGQFFYLFFKYPNVKSSILGCFGEWNGGGGWKWILGNKKRVGFIGRSLWKATINPAYGRFKRKYK